MQMFPSNILPIFHVQIFLEKYVYSYNISLWVINFHYLRYVSHIPRKTESNFLMVAYKYLDKEGALSSQQALALLTCNFRHSSLGVGSSREQSFRALKGIADTEFLLHRKHWEYKMAKKPGTTQNPSNTRKRASWNWNYQCSQ